MDKIPQIIKALHDEPCDSLEAFRQVKNAIEEMKAYLNHGKEANVTTICYIGLHLDLIELCISTNKKY